MGGRRHHRPGAPHLWFDSTGRRHGPILRPARARRRRVLRNAAPVLLPLLWRRVSRRHLVAGFAVLLALYLPFWDRRRLPIGSVPEVIDRFRFNGPIFSEVASLAGPAAATGFAIAAGLAVAAWARRRLSLASPQAWAWPMAAALLCAPLVYPWYLVWLTPFLVTPQTM